jgi:hypothetical protein
MLSNRLPLKDGTIAFRPSSTLVDCYILYYILCRIQLESACRPELLF